MKNFKKVPRIKKCYCTKCIAERKLKEIEKLVKE